MRTWVTFGVLLAGVGCNTRMIHPDPIQEPSRPLFARSWTFRTVDFASRNAGDRGFEFSNPIGFEKTLVFGTSRSGLLAIYPDTQTVRWQLEVPGGVTSELTREDKTVFFGSSDGLLYAVDLERGRVIWKYPTRSSYVSRPVFHLGKLYVTTSDDSVFALDAGSGQMMWTYRRRSSSPSSVLGASSPWIESQQILVGLSDGYLVSLTPEEGKIRWEKRLNEGRKFTDLDAQPVVSDQMAFVPAFDGALYALKKDGSSILWKSDSGGNKTPVVVGERIYQATSDGWIFCLDKNSGKTLWKFELDSGTATKMIVVDGKFLVFGSTARYLYALRLTDGDLAFRFDVGYDSGFSGTPLFDATSGRLVLLSKSGNLYSFIYRAPKT